MPGKHNHKPFEGHMHDFEAHIRAVEEDLEYYRAKRFEHPLYTVRFDVSEVSTCHDHDSIWVDVHEEWLSSLQPEERR